jgi:endogenous inhibitor of DNA gyrase (YacG/DUF329 family)
MITCPETGNPVPTGFDMDEGSFEGSTLTDNTFSPCPECGQAHTWSKEDAYLEP